MVISASLEDVAGNNLRGALDRSAGVVTKEVETIQIVFDVAEPVDAP